MLRQPLEGIPPCYTFTHQTRETRMFIVYNIWVFGLFIMLHLSLKQVNIILIIQS